MFFLYIKDGDSVFDRVEKFIGANNLSLIKSKVVMIVGLGGVGSFSVEALVRSGIENIIIVDYDTIDITNLNRQVMTNVSNIGKLKVDEVEARVLSINPKCSVSEFAGVPLDIQESKIRRGIKIFNSHDIRPKVFFAPSHTFDENTLMAIKNNSDIRIISDTVSNDVYYENDFYYVPQQVGHEANLPFKVVTICYHPNMMEEEDFIRFEKFIERYQDKCLKNSEEFNKILRKRKKSFYDKLLSSCYLILRKMRGLDK